MLHQFAGDYRPAFSSLIVSLVLSLLVIVISAITMGFTFILTLGIVPPFIYAATWTSIFLLFSQAFRD
jgi:hypothetical protein